MKSLFCRLGLHDWQRDWERSRWQPLRTIDEPIAIVCHVCGKRMIVAGYFDGVLETVRDEDAITAETLAAAIRR